MGLKLGMWILLLLWAVVGHEIWHWAVQFETFTERNCWACDSCAGEVWTEGGFTLTLFQGWGVGSEVLLEHLQLNFSFWNKVIILLPCGLLVDNNIFLKMCVFKSYTDYGGYENQNAHFLIIIKSKVRRAYVGYFNLYLAARSKWWTVPCPYLMVCFKNVI